MKKTTNYELSKIELTDAPPDITVLNGNWDTIDTELKTSKDHIDSGDVHVTTTKKTEWDSKAVGNHSHTLPSLGAAPSGFGLGDYCHFSRIKNPLDISLKSGVYGFTTYEDVTSNSPATDFLGYMVVHAWGNTSWHLVRAHNNIDGRIYENRYNENTRAWSGWQEILDKAFCLTPWIANVSGSIEQTFTVGLPFSPKYIICDSTSPTGPIPCTNKTVLLHSNEALREIVSTATGYIQVKFDVNTVTVKHKVLQGFGFKILGFQGGTLG